MNRSIHRRFFTAARSVAFSVALCAAFSASLVACTTPFVPPAVTPALNGLSGSYTGSYDAGIVKASVAVEVAQGGSIASITILSHTCSSIGKKAEAITGRVIKEQKLEVDVVAGATVSSKTILKAIETALRAPKEGQE